MIIAPSISNVIITASGKGGKGAAGRDSANDNPASDLRNMRRIIAEDPEWSLATVPLLTDLCIRHIVHNFESMKINVCNYYGVFEKNLSL